MWLDRLQRVTSTPLITLARLRTSDPPSHLSAGRLSLAPAYIATGAVVLYALGVVASVGHIRASGLDLTQAFSLIPLERHLRAGVATLLSGTVLGVLVVSAVLVGGLFFSLPHEEPNRESKSSDAPPARVGANDDRSRTGNAAALRASFFLGIFVVVMVWLSLMVPWTAVPVIFVTLGLILMLIRMQGRHAPRTALAIYASAVFALTGVVAVTEALFAGDPLPRATVTTAKTPITGPLIAINDGVVYLGPRRNGDLFQSVPTSEVVRMDVQRLRRPPERSLVQILGF